MRIPDGLSWWSSTPEGAAWLERLPDLVAGCCERWDLELGEPFEPATISYVARVERTDGRSAVLKVNFPEPESEHEPDALAFWGGDGAVELLERDDELRTLLVAYCEPGTQLWAIPDENEAGAIAAGVLRGLWKPAPVDHRFRLLADEAERWAEEIAADWERCGRPFERSIVDLGVGALLELGPTQGKQVVVHQDFHGGNVLLTEGSMWLTIDPKPLVGEREFDTASLVRDRLDSLLADPFPARRLRRRLDQLAADLTLDRERMRLWGVAHALAWGTGPDGGIPELVECARLLAEAG